ncbi:hypothetical protein AUEXF2481DRAFT_37697 [Aureobasidium subglaciale EXF-2481]|uniref:Uncharacterized protein n=1 Tax=Aureobasidium subglaciale (strain EXF-2481) TaxID=1043005 RepID=A0A074YSV3_AURSE|nr:uncharacterized protein AUEXF2481DRAFT_37697 [Aureobasidium subglaciale EXF-2481]KEQ97167.1 hypothetical protein AUEXF2481DRAFT_37697 [Aureobasidium subglaciale EXF-2481]
MTSPAFVLRLVLTFISVSLIFLVSTSSPSFLRLFPSTTQDGITVRHHGFSHQRNSLSQFAKPTPKPRLALRSMNQMESCPPPVGLRALQFRFVRSDSDYPSDPNMSYRAITTGHRPRRRLLPSQSAAPFAPVPASRSLLLCCSGAWPSPSTPPPSPPWRSPPRLP